MYRLIIVVCWLLVLPDMSLAESAREYFKFAKFSYESSDYPKALDFINRAIQEDPTYVSGFLLRAKIYYELNEFDEVIDDVSKAFELDKNAEKSMAEFHLLRARAYYNMGNYQYALNDVNISLRLKQDDDEAHFLKAMLQADKKIYFEALDELDDAIKINSQNPEYFYQRAVISNIHFHPLPQTATYKKVLADIDKSIELNPLDYRPYQLKCDMLKLDEHYNKQDLINELNEYVERFPDQSDFYAERGIAKVLNNNYSEALSDFTRAIHLDETNETNYRNRGLCFHNIKKYQLALNDYTKSIDLLIKKYNALQKNESVKKLLAQTFNMRGMSNQLNGNSDLACEDYYSAAKLGSKAGLNNYRKNCNVFR